MSRLCLVLDSRVRTWVIAYTMGYVDASAEARQMDRRAGYDASSIYGTPSGGKRVDKQGELKDMDVSVAYSLLVS